MFLKGLFFAFAILIGTCLVGANSAAWGQSTSGDLVGTVLDHTGAAISGAEVTATNVATGVATSTVANKFGDFHIPNLLPGTYNITGSANGFATFVLKNFDIKLNQTSAAKLVLPVATASTNVQVSAEASAVIDTTTTQLEASFEPEALKDLPTATQGLGVLNLTLLVPGVASSGAVGSGQGPSVGGMRPTDNNYTIEGIDNNNKSVPSPLVYVPNDAVGEFSVIVNQFSPEFGHSAGGQFNTTIKSGTNNLHGSAYGFNETRDYFAANAPAGGKDATTPRPRYDFNRYGGQVGGPIKKDKLFYFANYERQTTGQSSQYRICTPTAAGISALQANKNFNATNLGIYSKYMPVAASQVDASVDNACFNQTAGPQTLTVFDDAALNSTTGDYGTVNPQNIPLGNYVVNAPIYTNLDAFTASADWTLSSKDSFRGRYIYNKEDTFDTQANLPAFFQPVPYRYHLIAISEYHDFTPMLINEARLGFNRYYNITGAGNFSFPGLDMFPNLTIDDQDYLNIGPDGVAPQETIQNLYQFTDNVSWTKGKHSFKFGFDGRKFISPQSFTQRVRGDYAWNNLSEYLHDLAPTDQGERSTGNFIYYGDQTAFYAYANDTYHATEKLTLNMGIRYEFTAVPVGERQQALNSAASVPGLINFSSPQPQYTNFMPRVGINYAVDQQTSIRAGFGMALDVLFDNLGILSQPPQFSSTEDVGAQGQPENGAPNFLANGGLKPGTGSLAQFCQDETGPGTGTACVLDLDKQRAATSAFIPNQTLPYAENWTLGVQHVFHNDYTAEIRYVGTRGVKLPTQIQLNVQPRVTAANQVATLMQAPSAASLTGYSNTLRAIENLSNIIPAYKTAGFTGKLTSYQPWSSSNYNGLEAALNHQLKNGVMLNFAYTWSRAMDNATAPTFSTVFTPRRPQDSQNLAADYSRSALDHTHRITLAAVYDLPYFKTSRSLLKNTLGNWELAPIYTYESPEYFTVLSGVNSNLNGDTASQIDRTIYNPKGVKHTGSDVVAYANPNLVNSCKAGTTATDPNGTLLCDDDLVAYVPVNSNATYIVAGKGTLPTAERNTEPIRPINNLDATAIKRFNFTERYSLEFQAQAFNVLNHAQYLPGTIDNINSPEYLTQTDFQTASSGGFNQPQKFFNANARTMQLGLKFSF